MFFLALLAGLAAAPVTIHPDRLGPSVRHDTLGGFVLHVSNDSSLYPPLVKGLRELGNQVFRYPSGTTSNDYHWNGDGRFDPDSVWIASDSSFSPGFSTMGIHRGTSKNNVGIVHPSAIDDGDTTTVWWSHPDLPSSSGWFLFDFDKAVAFDSISLWLGDLAPDSLQIRISDRVGWVESIHDLDRWTWKTLATVGAKSARSIRFSAATAQYLAIRPIGRLPRGWKVRECEVWKSGRRVSVSDRDEIRQTRVEAASAHPASRRDRYDWNWDFESFMRFVRNYPGSVPMICVNVGTGTPQEAAAWVRYANVVRKYGIHRWQIGNEMSMSHEEGGSLSARQYATRFVQFAKAMKAVDPTIAVVGPVDGSQILRTGSGDADGRTWMAGFLAYLDSAEKADHVRYVEGVDIHTYPYWFDAAPSPTTYMQLADGVGTLMDTLASIMDHNLSDRSGREVMMSEYNPAISRSSLDLDVIGGSGAALMLAHFVQRFGDRGIALFFDLYEPNTIGPDGTWGALTTFLQPQNGVWSSLGYLPNSSFWALRTVLREWLDPRGGDTVVAIDQTPGVRTFAVRNHGKLSILAVNLTNQVVRMQFDPSPMRTTATLIQWGDSNYRIRSIDGTASPFPANGPTGAQLDEWSGEIALAPYGLTVVRTGIHSEDSKTPFLAVFPAKTSISDTFRLCGWSRAGNFSRPGYWVSTSASGGLDYGSTNYYRAVASSWTARIPASALGLGEHLVRIVLPVGDDSIVDTVRLTVTGDLRSVVRVADFESGKPENVWGASWWTQPSAKIDSSGGILAVEPDAMDGSRFLSSKVHVGQSASLGYDNFVATIVPLPRETAVSDDDRDVVGLGFDWKTSASSGCRFALALNTSSVKDWDFHQAPLAATQGRWTRSILRFEDFQQQGWGKTVAFDPSALKQLEFRAIGDCDGTVSIDNVVLVGTRGVPVGAVLRPPASSKACIWRSGRLFVDVPGAWTARMVGADGRIIRKWEGTGKDELKVRSSAGIGWIVLESDGIRQVVPVAPDLVR